MDNSNHPNITVNIQLTRSTPADATKPVPLMMQFGFNFGAFARAARTRPTERIILPHAVSVGATSQRGSNNVSQKGWGYAVITPTTVQTDNGAGLASGHHRALQQRPVAPGGRWGALRAWAWARVALDYFETDKTVDARRVGRALALRQSHARGAMAYDSRFAAAYVSSSGEGGAKLHRRDWGEIVENVAGSGELSLDGGQFHQICRPVELGRPAGGFSRIDCVVRAAASVSQRGHA